MVEILNDYFRLVWATMNRNIKSSRLAFVLMWQINRLKHRKWCCIIQFIVMLHIIQWILCLGYWRQKLGLGSRLGHSSSYNLDSYDGRSALKVLEFLNNVMKEPKNSACTHGLQVNGVVGNQDFRRQKFQVVENIAQNIEISD